MNKRVRIEKIANDKEYESYLPNREELRRLVDNIMKEDEDIK